MKRLRMLLIGAALMTGGSALVSAQPVDHDGRHQVNRDRERDDRGFRGDRDYRRFHRDYDRDDRRFFQDRDDRRFDRYRDDRRFVEHFDRPRYVFGERRFFNGYYWTWDGDRWCRRDGRFTFYFNF